MEKVAQQLVDKWKEIIQSINVNGYSRRVDSVDLFRMTKYYTGYPEVEFCYKATFNFPFQPEVGIRDRYSSTSSNEVFKKQVFEKWNLELEKTFIQFFHDPRFEFFTGYNSGETKFENSKVDYMTNQGYRFIIQFYPGGFLSDLRNEKLLQIGI